MTNKILKQVLLEEGAKDYPDTERIQNAIEDLKFKHNVVKANDVEVLDFIERTFNLIGCLKTKSRVKKFVFSRYCYFWYLYEIKGYPLTKIGHLYGFDHATVLYGRNEIIENHRTLHYHEEVTRVKLALSK
jgi:chromosomal replication initiation ATPase DnaA